MKFFFCFKRGNVRRKASRIIRAPALRCIQALRTLRHQAPCATLLLTKRPIRVICKQRASMCFDLISEAVVQASSSVSLNQKNFLSNPMFERSDRCTEENESFWRVSFASKLEETQKGFTSFLVFPRISCNASTCFLITFFLVSISSVPLNSSCNAESRCRASCAVSRILRLCLSSF